jgi:RNA polymerase sigma-70 factor, ECF subfamily
VIVADLAGVLAWSQDEADLVAELQNGSDEAFDWLLTHYHGPVYSLLFGMLGESADAADSTQEVFLKAFRGIRAFRRGSSLKTWLYRIAVREALNSKRWRWRHLRHQVSLEAEREAQGGFAEPRDSGESPFEWMAARELQGVVHRALQQVPAVFRTAVFLRDLEGLGYEEIGEILEISVGTVKSRIMRGRQCLREILEPLLAPRHRSAAVADDAARGDRSFERGWRKFAGSAGLGSQPTGRAKAARLAAGGGE